MNGDATLFSRTDLVETAWRIAQPMLDYWKQDQPTFPNYAAGSWGPKAAYDLIENDGRKWVEVLNRESLERVPLFEGADPVLLASLILELKPVVFQPGEEIIRKGDTGHEMYLIARGEVEVVGASTLHEGDFFGEVALLTSASRNATVRAKSYCDLFVLHRENFERVLREHPAIAETIRRVAASRYRVESN